MAWEIDCRELADRVLTDVPKANENDAANLADQLQVVIDEFVAAFSDEEEEPPVEPTQVDPSKRDEDIE